MCEPSDPLDSIRDLAMDILVLHHACDTGSCERRIIHRAGRNIHDELIECVKRLQHGWKGQVGDERRTS
jgi:hypothetical protein